MPDQTKAIAQALEATRGDLSSLSYSFYSITAYLFERIDKQAEDGACHFTFDQQTWKEAPSHRPVDILDDVRLRAKHLTNQKGGLNAGKIREIFDLCQTDKGYLHNYEEIYSRLFELVCPTPKILEIGTGAPESGYAGTPGGSIAAWMTAFPSASVIAVDIHPLDSKYLPVPQNRGGTLEYICADQTNLAEMQQLADQLQRDFGSFDLIIDDGLHAPHAVIPTVLACAPLMHSQSFYVIEDVPPSLVDSYLRVFELCGLEMIWAPWKTSANARVNQDEPYPGKDTRIGCAMVGVRQE